MYADMLETERIPARIYPRPPSSTSVAVHHYKAALGLLARANQVPGRMCSKWLAVVLSGVYVTTYSGCSVIEIYCNAGSRILASYTDVWRGWTAIGTGTTHRVETMVHGWLVLAVSTNIVNQVPIFPPSGEVIVTGLCHQGDGSRSSTWSNGSTKEVPDKSSSLIPCTLGNIGQRCKLSSTASTSVLASALHRPLVTGSCSYRAKHIHIDYLRADPGLTFQIRWTE